MTAPLFLAPLRLEAFAVRRGASGAEVDQLGMGPARATAARARLTRSVEPGRPIVLIGFGGALVEGISPGDVVVAREIGSTEGLESVYLASAEDVGELLMSAGLRTHVGQVASSPTLVRGDVARQKAASGGAIAVDMESLWCAPLARTNPLAVVRAIVDAPGRDVAGLSTPFAARRAWRSIVLASRALAHWSPANLDNYPLLEA